ncbi:MAG: GIY-YIG nuclease family protein [bacterium]|nr:GIY-YIG nuclease family protein [bacterium]
MILKDQIKELPTKPGVYHFLDENGGVLYVGKAKNLKNRLRQYFLRELGRGPAIVQMVRLAVKIKWLETESEIEAVLLEAEQIQKLKPKYNVRQKDDKSFLVIRITKKSQKSKVKSQNDNSKFKNVILSETKNLSRSFASAQDDSSRFPCVELVRFRNADFSDKTAEYFGPYPSGELLKKSLRYLRKVFPFRDCSKTKFNTYRKRGRPCVYGDIRVCTGPCAGYVNEKEYARNIKFLKEFLRGKKVRVIRTLKKEMLDLSRKKHYEEAANVRNQFQALNHINDVAIGVRDDLFEASSIMFKRIECYDISNILDQYAVGSMIVFTDGKPDKAEYRKFKVKSSPLRQGYEGQVRLKVGEEKLPNNDLARFEQVLTRRFANDWPKPDLVIIDGGTTHLEVAKLVLKRYNLSIPSVSISKGPQRLKNDFHFSDSIIAKYFKGNDPLKNVAIMARDESHRFAISYYRTLHQKSIYH